VRRLTAVPPNDKRWFVGLLCYVVLRMAVFLVRDVYYLGHDDWLWHRVLARKNWTATVQAVGSLIAFLGLWRAYARARYDLTVPGWLKSVADRLWRWICRKPRRGQDIVIAAPTMTAHVEASATAYVTFVLDTTLTVEEQIAGLVQFVNDRSKDGVGVQNKLVELGRDLRNLQSRASEIERNTLQRIDSRITELDDKINRTQVLDLIPAIVGLGITAFGTLFGIGA
jgi:hypothetical protein